jgi:plastocyanin
MTGTRVRIVVASVAAVLMVAGFSAAVNASPHRGSVTTIRALGSSYSSPHWAPTRVSIEEGWRIKWTARQLNHTVVAYGGNWTFRHNLPLGTSVTRRFADSGTYLFRCGIHSSVVNGRCEGMCGKIVVH